MDNYLIENVELENIDFDHVNDDLPRYGEGFDYNGEKSNWCVYVHINKINGKMYIGISSNLRDRWSNKGNRYKGCDAIYNAFQKYGWDNFKHIVLMNGLTSKMADSIEIYLIEKYHTHAETGDGYNIASGGYGFDIKYGKDNPVSKSIHMYDLNGIYIQSFDTISEANSLFSIQKNSNGVLSDAIKSDSHFAYGFLWSDIPFDTLDPFYPMYKKYYNEIHNPNDDLNYGKIVQLSRNGILIKIYKSIYHVSNDASIRRCVLECCKKYNNKIIYNNNIWMFEDDYIKCDIDQLINDYIKHNSSNQNRPVSVYDFEGNFINKYSSASEASKILLLDCSAISKVCNGKKKSCGGFQFRYSDEPAPGRYIISKPVSNYRLKYKIAQIDITSNHIINIFSSYPEIKKVLNIKISCSNINLCITGKYNKSYGYIWRYIDDNGNIIEPNQIIKEG